MAYPVYLNLADKEALVVGAGAVGCRKVHSLLEGGIHSILLLDPYVQYEDLKSRYDLPYDERQLQFEARAFCAEDLDGKALAFAATNNREVNAAISALCREKRILCNVADALKESDFIVPAHFTQDAIHVAVSTGGHSPALAAVLRRELEEWVGKRYNPLIMLLARLRPILLGAGGTSRDNAIVFRTLVSSPLPDLLENKDLTSAEAVLEQILPVAVHSSIGDLLNGL